MSDEYQVQVGSTVEVDLEGSPTSGYRWELLEDKDAPAQLMTKAVAPNLGLAGGKAQFRFTFRGLRAGRTRLKFVYKRPWEAEPRTHHEVLLTIVNRD